MKIWFIAVIAALSLPSCKDMPYSELREKKLAEYVFTGMVELGTPVNGSTIQVYQFSGLKTGEKIAEAISSRDGGYSLNLETDYDGPLLLIATGGVYRDLATGEDVALKPGQQLSSAITHIKMPEKTNINAWTTMAVARVKADRGFWDSGIAELKDIDRINVDFSQISYFLAGKSTKFINIRRQEFFDIDNNVLKLDEPKATLHLTHGGLSQLAKNFSFILAEEGVVVSLVDLLSVLADDLSDRVFDGRNATGNTVYVGNNHRLALDSYTMRKQLAEAMLVYFNQLKKAGKVADAETMSQEFIIDSLAKDARPELFPEREKPKPVDMDAPKIAISFAADRDAKENFSVLDGDVYLDVAVQDESPIAEIKMLAPSTSRRDGKKFGPISPNHTQDPKEIAMLCDRYDEFKDQLKEKNLKQENVQCVCFEATDIIKNASKELACFQRRAPKSLIEFPTDNIFLTMPIFQRGVRAKAIVKSGMPFTECSWAVVDRNNAEAYRAQLPKGQGIIDGLSCIINQPLLPETMPNGSYFLTIEAKDIGGRTLSEITNAANENYSTFRVMKL